MFKLRANYRTRMMAGWPGNCSRMPLGNESGRLIDVKQANHVLVDELIT